MNTLKNLIIGAGPAGLAVAGCLRKKGLDFEVLEATDKIAWSWTNHYDRLCLHTVKQLSHLPHLPFPEDYPLYVPREDLVRYYEQYADHFNIHPHFGERVDSIQKKEGQYEVRTRSGKVFLTENVIIATGANRVPHSPNWPQQETYQGELIHSRHYKSAKPYKGQKVLIIGMGNTGAEVALDLSEQGAEPYLSVRSAVNIVPRDLNGRPTQLTARQLAKLPFGLGDWLGTMIRKFVVGDLSKYGLQTATIAPAKQLRETGKTPIIDLGTIDHIRKGKIKVMPDIERFSASGVVFKNGQEVDFDAIIVATGYRAKVTEFMSMAAPFIDKNGFPKGPIGKGELAGSYFIGFDNYKLGGLLGTIYNDSQTIADTIAATTPAAVKV
ncbi:MAG: NAD(P)/FAD-dependent oxidoreductase [Bacteroidota bacterium]